MKRSEPQWKREAARAHCKYLRDRLWNTLSGKWAHTFIIGDCNVQGAQVTNAGVNIQYETFTISDLDVAAKYKSGWSY